jgi:hypothetical protein
MSVYGADQVTRLSASGRECPFATRANCTLIARSSDHRSSSPTLLRSLAGDTEPGTDLGPGIALTAQALDRLGHGGIDLLGQADEEGQEVPGQGIF